MKVKLFVMTGIVLLATQLFNISAIAQDRNPTLDETITVRLGPFLANFNATVKAFGQDLEMDENLSTDDVNFAIYGLWRITPRLRLEAGYSGINTTTGEELGESINIGSLTIPAGLSLEGEFETEVLRMALGYAFMRGDSSEFGVDLGVNYTTIKESFQVSMPGIPGGKLNSIDVSEPLPTIGLFFNYAFTPELYMTTRFGAFAFDIGDIDGTIFDLFGGLEYRPW